jgi:hypothetical protein
MIEKGQHIRCMFHNGFVVEGVVEDWTAETAVLLSLADESKLIIHNTSRDIMFTKVVLQEKEKVSVPEIDKSFEETLKEPSSDLKNRKLAELRILKAQAEKKIISNRLKDHHIGQTRTVEYGLPGFYSK